MTDEGKERKKVNNSPKRRQQNNRIYGELKEVRRHRSIQEGKWISGRQRERGS